MTLLNIPYYQWPNAASWFRNQVNPLRLTWCPYSCVIMMHGSSTGVWFVLVHHAQPSDCPWGVGMMQKYSTGEVLVMAALLHHDNKRHGASKHYAASTILGRQSLLLDVGPYLALTYVRRDHRPPRPWWWGYKASGDQRGASNASRPPRSEIREKTSRSIVLQPRLPLLYINLHHGTATPTHHPPHCCYNSW